MTDEAGSEQPLTDAARQLAALYGGVANDQERLADLFGMAADAVVMNNPDDANPFEAIAQRVRNTAYQSRTAQRVTAEQARAFEDYEKAGGASNPEAKARMDEVWEQTTSLMPDEFDGNIGT